VARRAASAVIARARAAATAVATVTGTFVTGTFVTGTFVTGTIVAAAAGAQVATPSRPTLHDVVSIAIAQNPQIVTARLQVDSAHAERRIAKEYPNPTASVIPGVPFQYGLSDDLDVGPTRFYRVKAASIGLRATRSTLADVQRTVVFAVRQAFYDLLLANALDSLSADERGIYRQLLGADSVRLRTGDAPASDVTTSELNLARADAAASRARANVRSARLALQLLMGVTHPDTGFQIQGSLRYQPVDAPVDRPDSLLAVAQAERPDVRAAQLQLDQSRALRKETGWLLLPTPNLGLSWQPGTPYPGAFPFGEHSNFTLALGVPIPLFNQYGGEREKSKAGVAVATVAARESRRQAESDVIQATDSLRAAAVLAGLYQGGLLEKTRQAVANAQFAYQHGAISLLDLLDAIRTNQDIRTEYVTAVHDYWVAVFSLDRAVGRDLVPDETSPP